MAASRGSQGGDPLLTACGLCRGVGVGPIAPFVCTQNLVPGANPELCPQPGHAQGSQCPQAGSVPVSPPAAIAPPSNREQTWHLLCGQTAPEFQWGKNKAIS